MIIEDNYIVLDSVIHMANVVTRDGRHVIIVRLKDNPEPIWIANPNRISVSDLIQENLNASNSNKNNASKPTYKPTPREDRFNRDDESESGGKPASKPASKPKRGRSSKRSSKKPDKDIAAAAAAADAKYAAARAAYALLTADNATESSTDAEEQADCSSDVVADGGNPF